MSAPEAVLLAVGVLAIVLGAVLQRITGIGFGATSAPPLILLLGPVVGVQVIHLLAAICSLALLVERWRDVDRGRAATLAVTALAATPAGVVLALALPEAVLQISMGVVMLTALVAVRPLARSRLMRSRLGVVATGALSGIANATVGQAGPLMGAYALASRWSMQRYVASIQVCWLLANVAALLLKGPPPISSPVAAVLLGSLAAGIVLSFPVARAMPRTAAVRCLVVVAVVGSAAVLAKGVGGLAGP